MAVFADPFGSYLDGYRQALDDNRKDALAADKLMRSAGKAAKSGKSDAEPKAADATPKLGQPDNTLQPKTPQTPPSASQSAAPPLPPRPPNMPYMFYMDEIMRSMDPNNPLPGGGIRRGPMSVGDPFGIGMVGAPPAPAPAPPAQPIPPASYAPDPQSFATPFDGMLTFPPRAQNPQEAAQPFVTPYDMTMPPATVPAPRFQFFAPFRR